MDENESLDSTPEEKQDRATLEEAARALGESFDSVVIIVTKPHSTGAGYVFAAEEAGNGFASITAAQRWLLAKEEKFRQHCRD